MWGWVSGSAMLIVGCAMTAAGVIGFSSLEAAAMGDMPPLALLIPGGILMGFGLNRLWPQATAAEPEFEDELLAVEDERPSAQIISIHAARAKRLPASPSANATRSKPSLKD